MAHNIEPVIPGDVIRSDLIKQLVEWANEVDATIGDLEARIEGGPVKVPNVFGRTVQEARVILESPSLGLRLGNVIDVDGKSVNTDIGEGRLRMILGQSPGAETRVSLGTFVHVVVVGEPGDGTQPDNTPAISRVVPEKQNIHATITIIGENFMTNESDNVVTFAGQPATILESWSSAIDVLVSMIPDPPEGTEEKLVSLVVTTPYGRATDEFIVLAPLPQELPVITGITPPIVSADDTIVISGSRFSNVLGENEVFVADKPATVTAPAIDSLSATVPQLDGPFPRLGVKVRVMVNGTEAIPATSGANKITVAG